MSDSDETCWREGLRLAETGQHWEAHEAIEEMWRARPPGALRECLQALIQTFAVAYKIVQAQENRSASAMQRGMARLITSARGHLDASRGGAARPRWAGAIESALGDLEQVLRDWESGALSTAGASRSADAVIAALVERLPDRPE